MRTFSFFFGAVCSLQVKEWSDVVREYKGINGTFSSLAKLTSPLLESRVSSSSSSSTSTSTPSSALGERARWLIFYEATNGPHWNNNSGWNTTLPICDWFGVRCCEGAVSALELPANNLSGTVPESTWENWTGYSVDFTSNDLNGSLPLCLGNTIVADYNRFSGSISCTGVYGSWRLSHNKFTSLNCTECSLPIDLSWNELTEVTYNGAVSSSIFSLYDYNYISRMDVDLSACYRGGFSASHNRLTHVVLPTACPVLDFSYNQLISVALPDQTPHVYSLNLEHNSLTSLNVTSFMAPDFYGPLAFLEVSSNQLSSETFSGCPTLILNARDNLLTQLPNCPGLTQMLLDRNQLTELSFSPDFGNIIVLSLTENNISSGYFFPGSLVDLSQNPLSEVMLQLGDAIDLNVSYSFVLPPPQPSNPFFPSPIPIQSLSIAYTPLLASEWLSAYYTLNRLSFLDISGTPPDCPTILPSQTLRAYNYTFTCRNFSSWVEPDTSKTAFFEDLALYCPAYLVGSVGSSLEVDPRDLDYFGCSCAPISYWDSFTQQCAPCPKEVDCDRYVGKNDHKVKSGYFAFSENLLQTAIFPCQLSTICNSPHSSSTCAPGHTGPLCGACLPQFYRVGLECTQCQDWFSVGVPLSNLVGLAFLLVLLFFKQTDLREENFEEAEGQGERSDDVLSICAFYLQLQDILGSSRVVSSESTVVASLRSTFSVVLAFRPWAFECLFQEYNHIYSFWVVIALPALFFLVFLLWQRSQCCIARCSSDTPLFCLVYLLNLCYFPVTVRILQFFNCQSALDPVTQRTLATFMVSSPATSCASSAFLIARTAAIVCAVLYVIGAPCCMVWSRKKKNGSLWRVSFFLWLPFKQSMWWWRCLLTLRQLLLSIVLTLLPFQSYIIPCLVGLILIVFSIFQTRFSPYANSRENRLETILLSFALVSYYFRVIEYANSAELEAEMTTFSTTLSLIQGAGYVVVVSVLGFYGYSKGQKLCCKSPPRRQASLTPPKQGSLNWDYGMISA